MEASKFAAKFGGKKFGLCAVVVILSSVFQALGSLTQADYVLCIKFVLATYLAGTIGQTVLMNTINNADRALGEFEEKEVLGRKFILSVLCYLAGIVLLYFKFINGESYIAITLAVVGLYVSGNVLDKLSSLGLTTNSK